MDTENNLKPEADMTHATEAADDITIEADVDLDDSVVGEENAQAQIKKLREKIKTLEGEKLEYLTGWQKDKAEFINARKRSEEGQKDIIRFANENLISELIPVLGSFTMAFNNKEAWEKVDKNWRVGVEYIYSQLKKVLTDAGLAEIDPLGQKFDPARDEAVSFVPVTEESQDHVVIGVIQKGYSLNGKIITPPKVSVGEFKK